MSQENGVGNSINVFSFGYTDPAKILFFKRHVDAFFRGGGGRKVEKERKWSKKMAGVLPPSIFHFSRGSELLFYRQESRLEKLPKIIVSVLHRCTGQGWCCLVLVRVYVQIPTELPLFLNWSCGADRPTKSIRNCYLRDLRYAYTDTLDTA